MNKFRNYRSGVGLSVFVYGAAQIVIEYATIAWWLA